MEIGVCRVWGEFKNSPYREVIESGFPVSGYKEFVEESLNGWRWVTAEHDRQCVFPVFLLLSDPVGWEEYWVCVPVVFLWADCARRSL